MNHTHGAHARHTGRLARVLSLGLPDVPAHTVARTMAQQLDGALSEGSFPRLNMDDRVELRALVMALEKLADRLETEEQQRQPMRGRVWWRFGR